MALDNSRFAHEERIRIGPISLFTLIAVICLAVLSVLAISTANASLTMSQRMADSVEALYQNEAMAQEFLSDIDGVLSRGNAADVELALDSICERATAANEQSPVDISAEMRDDVVHAVFTSGNGRTLTIEVTIRDNQTYRIDKWEITAVQNEEMPQGNLLIVE